MAFKFLSILLLLSSFTVEVYAISIEREQELNAEFKEYCDNVSDYVIKNRYTVICSSDYQHFNARAGINHYNEKPAHDIRIANYNMLHPGSNKNSYKDLVLLAKIINEYDLISAQELIPRLGNDMRHNRDLVEMIKKDAKEAENLSKLYRSPGYVLILDELRKLDPSWALIMSPRGEAASPSSVHEMLGFFYRASIVRPKVNEHCEEFATSKEEAIACYPLFRAPFFREDVADAFSRKPFLASFESGNFDFSLLNAHVIYTSSKDEELMRFISNIAFGIDDYSQVGTGVTKETYARFAEVKLALEMLDLLADRYSEQDLIFAADMNLESKISYFEVLMKQFSRFDLVGEMATSLTPYRYGRGNVETNGFSSNYDHFILNNEANAPCARDAKGKVHVTRQSYFENHVDEWMKKYYVAREETGDPANPYQFSKAGEELMKERIQEHREMLEQTMTVVDGTIVAQYDDVDREVEIFKRRIFEEQLSDQTYYKFYRELISDHFPISISCKN